jgi:hypothetical protein
MKEKVTSSKKNTVITLSDEVTELSSIKCTVENWKVILDTCVQHGSEQNCFEDFYTSGYKIHFPQNSVCFQK